MNTWTFASIMYLLGLFSCAAFVRAALGVGDKIKPTLEDMQPIAERFQEWANREDLRNEAKMCIQQYCVAVN